MWIVRKIRELRMVIENKLTMREVEKDPAVKDAKVPEELEKAIFDEIARIEERREKERQIIENLSPENRRLFHMGERQKKLLKKVQETRLKLTRKQWQQNLCKMRRWTKKNLRKIVRKESVIAGCCDRYFYCGTGRRRICTTSSWC